MVHHRGGHGQSRNDETKQANRRGRVQQRRERGGVPGASGADMSAVLSQRLWKEVVAPATLPDRGDGGGVISEVTGSDRKQLRAFYHHAVAGDVSKDHITEGAAVGFVIDKWTARCDKMSLALLC